MKGIDRIDIGTECIQAHAFVLLDFCVSLLAVVEELSYD